jgi:prepilin-type N-terminal cleavage/methylation domain-containing protein
MKSYYGGEGYMGDDRGVTLVELIVVVLIMGILSGSAVIGYRSLDSGNAKATVTRISALLDFVQVENMSMDKNYYLVIEKQGTSFVAKVQYEVSGVRTDLLKETLKLKEGQITYYSEASPIEHSYIIEDTTPSPVTLEVSYLKASGAFRQKDIDRDGVDEDIKRIEITSSGRKFTIYLVTATGKHYIK